MSEIRVIIKKPGEAAFETLVENELRPLQEWVGGYIETYALSYNPAVLVICNEEGKIMGLPYNCKLAGEHFAGTILICGVDGEEFADCPVRLKTAAAFWPELAAGRHQGDKGKASTGCRFRAQTPENLKGGANNKK